MGAAEQIPGRFAVAERPCGHHASGSQAHTLPPGSDGVWAAGLGRLGAPPPTPGAVLGAASSPQPLENWHVEAGALAAKDSRASLAGRQEAGVGLQHRGRGEAGSSQAA